MRTSLLIIITAIIFIATGCQLSSDKKNAIAPNILLVLVDDMGYGDVSGAGNVFLNTPNLDDLASRSVNFKHFYVSPVCAPTRASLLTGRYHQEVGVRSVTNGFEIMDPQAVTLAELLKMEDYRTAIFGKWHLGEYYPSVPNAQGFDEYLGFRTGHTSDYYDAVLEHNGKQETTQGYITDMFTDRALEWMNDDSEDPFFCYLAYNAPHSPLQIDSAYFDKFLEMGLNDKTSRVYGMVENIDENIGNLLSDLERSGNLKNTVVVFLSDNGPISGWKVPQNQMRYNAGLRDQKFTTYDGGIRTQCYWMWQGQWAPFYDTTSVAAHIDLVPTIAKILNLNLADSLSIDGYDLSNVLASHQPLDVDRVFFEDYNLESLRSPHLFDGGIARMANWKLVGGSELYDVINDPGETQNLAKDNPAVFSKLKSAYEKFFSSIYANDHVLPSPILVGFDEENTVHIKAHHGMAQGNVSFMGPRGHYGETIGRHPTGDDGDWTSNWKQEGDGMQWDIKFVSEATYEVGITVNGNIRSDSCKLQIIVGDQDTVVTLPGIQSIEEWSYIPLLQLQSNDVNKVRLILKQIADSDSLNVNELVVKKEP